MQRFFFLFVLLGLYSCQAVEHPDGPSLGQLLSTYQRLPAHYQQLDMADLLYLKPIAQKVRLKQELKLAESRRQFDSLLFHFLGEPFTGFEGSCKTWTEQPSLRGDSVEILVRYTMVLNTQFEFYYVGKNGFYHQIIQYDPNCYPLAQTRPLTTTCLTLLSQQERPTDTDQLAELKTYLEKSDFLDAPAQLETGCLDGDYITVYVKEGNQFKVASAHCPNELQPLRIIFRKTQGLF